jgi:hypothetical protein
MQGSALINQTSTKPPTKSGTELPIAFRRKKEFGALGSSLAAQRPETSDRSAEMAATTSRTSVDISHEVNVNQQQQQEAEANEEAELRLATTESAPVTMSVEAPPQGQLGRRQGSFFHVKMVSNGFQPDGW